MAEWSESEAAAAESAPAASPTFTSRTNCSVCAHAEFAAIWSTVHMEACQDSWGGSIQIFVGAAAGACPCCPALTHNDKSSESEVGCRWEMGVWRRLYWF